MANTKSLDLEASSSQYASIADGSQTGLDITGDISIEAWIKRESIGAEMAIATKWSTDGSNRSYRLFFNSTNKIQVDISSDGSTSTDMQFTSDDTNTSTDWQHIAVTWDASAGRTGFNMYVNGVSVDWTENTSYNATSIANSNAPFYIGATAIGGTSARYYDGLIEHARIWNDIRTPAEIRQYMFQEPATDAAGLVSWWKFDNDYTDETSNGNDLTASGSPVFSTDVQWTDGGTGKSEIEECVDDDTVALWHMNGAADSAAKKDNAEGTAGYDLTEVNAPTSVAGFDGEANGAYEFNGSDQYLSVADNAGLDYLSTDKTIEFWFNADDTTGVQTIISKWAASNQDYICYLDGTTLTVAVLGDTSNNVTTTVAASTLYYVAMTMDSSKNIKLYINGVLVDSNTSTGTVSSSTGEFRIGQNGDSNYYYGVIDEVAISTRVKSAEEIAKYYSGRVSAKYYTSLDGYARNQYSGGSGVDWSVIRADAGNASATTTVDSLIIADTTTDKWGDFRRGITLFDISPISSDNTIVSAKYALDVEEKYTDRVESISVCECDPASESSIANGDYDSFLDTKLATDITVASMTAESFAEFDLNSTGLTFLEDEISDNSGIARLGVRATADIDDSEPTWGSEEKAGVRFYSDDDAGKEPYLWVEYTAEGTTEITPDTITAEATVNAPTISYGVNVTPTTITSELTVQAPTITGEVNITPSTITSQVTIYDPIVDANTTVTPDTITIESTIHAPTISYGMVVEANTITSEATLNAPTITYGMTVTPDVITSEVTIHDPIRIGGLWTPRTKPSTSWTDRTKPSTSWTKRTKPSE